VDFRLVDPDRYRWSHFQLLYTGTGDEMECNPRRMQPVPHRVQVLQDMQNRNKLSIQWDQSKRLVSTVWTLFAGA